MALYVTRPRRDEVRIGRGLPSGPGPSFEEISLSVSSLVDIGAVILEKNIFWSRQLFFSLSHYFDIKEVT